LGRSTNLADSIISHSSYYKELLTPNKINYYIIDKDEDSTWGPFDKLEFEKIKKEIDNNNIDVILNVKKFSKTMYYKMIGATIMEILKSEYQEMLEDTKKNDK